MPGLARREQRSPLLVVAAQRVRVTAAVGALGDAGMAAEEVADARAGAGETATTSEDSSAFKSFSIRAWSSAT